MTVKVTQRTDTEMIRNLNESLQVPAVSDDLTQCCDDHFLKLNTSKNQTYE